MGGMLPPCRKESGCVCAKCDSRTAREEEFSSETILILSRANSSSIQPRRTAALNAVGTGHRVYQRVSTDIFRSCSLRSLWLGPDLRIGAATFVISISPVLDSRTRYSDWLLEPAPEPNYVDRFTQLMSFLQNPQNYVKRFHRTIRIYRDHSAHFVRRLPALRARSSSECRRLQCAKGV